MNKKQKKEPPKLKPKPIRPTYQSMKSREDDELLHIHTTLNSDGP